MQVDLTERQLFLVRIERLERQNRVVRFAGLVAVLIGMAAMCIGMSAPRRSLETELILIKDATGSTRMILGMSDDGPAITMLDAKGRLRANIGVTERGPEFDFLDAAETPRLQMFVDEKQVPRLNLLDNRGTQVTFQP